MMLKNIFYILFLIEAIFILFFNDIICSIWDPYLRNVDEVLPLLIWFLAIITKQKLNIRLNFNLSLKFFATYSVYILIYSLPDIVEKPHIGNYVFPFKIFTFFINLEIFASYRQLTGRTYRDYLKLLVYLGVVYIIFNTVFYFIPLPIWNETSRLLSANTIGRITCGYATTDSVMLVLCLMCVLGVELGFSKGGKIFLVILFVIGILIQASGTGTISLLILLCVYLFYKWRYVSLKVVCKSVLVLLVLVCTFIKFVNIDNYSLELEGAINILENRFTSLSPNNDLEYNTLDIRDGQYEMAQKHFVKTIYDAVFGVGWGNYTNKLELCGDLSRYIFIENQFDSLKIAYGYLGYVIFLLVFVEYYFRYRLFKKDETVSFVYISTLSLFLCNCYTAMPLFGFQEVAFFALILSFAHLSLKGNNMSI